MRAKHTYGIPGSAVLVAAMLLGASCSEDVVTVDLDRATPRIVIEGAVTPGLGPHTVRLTKTTDFFKPSDYSPVTGAVIAIADSASGATATLAEREPGVYTTDAITGVIGGTYTLAVKVEGMEYRASSTMNVTGHIDSLAFEVDDEEEEQYIVHCYFKDTEGRKEYYRFKLYINGVQYEEYSMYQDRLTDGNNIDGELWITDETITDGDVIVVEMQTIDRRVYDYFWTLTNAATESSSGMIMFGGTPANPTSNLSSSALGYFSAYSAHFDTLIVDMAKAIK